MKPEYDIEWIRYHLLFSSDNIIRIRYKIRGLDDYITTTIYNPTNREHNLVKTWAEGEISAPEPRMIAGKPIERKTEIKRIDKSLMETELEQSYFKIGYINKDNFSEEGGSKEVSIQDLNAIASPILYEMEKQIIQKVESDIAGKLGETITRVEKKKHVFIAYREKDESKTIAQRIGEYLLQNGIQPWFFPWNMSVGDSITEKEEAALENAFASIIVFTKDFLEGRTAKVEYRALQALIREKPEFRICVLRVNCSVDDLPAFLKDGFSVKITSMDDENFEQQIEYLAKGVLELPLETPST